MKKTTNALLLLAVTCALFACSADDKVDGSEKTMKEETTTVAESTNIEATTVDIASVGEETTQKPTGREEGNIQKEYVYYNGTLYEYSRLLSSLTKENIGEIYSEYVSVGKIQNMVNTEVPSVEYQAANYDVGSEIYANADDNSKIIVDLGDSFVEMKKVD